MEKHFTYTKLCDHFERRGDNLSKEALDWIVETEVRKSKKIQNVCSDFIKRFEYSGVTEAVIYGAGDYGRLLHEMFVLHNIEVLAFIDNYKTGTYLGKPIITPNDYVSLYSDMKCAVSVIGGARENRERIEIQFNELGADLNKIYFMSDEWIGYPVDECSELLCARSGEPRWFSLPELSTHMLDLFVDVGSNDGQAVDDYFEWRKVEGGRAYSLEILPEQYKLQKKKYEKRSDITVIHSGCGKENGYLNFTGYAGCASAKITNKDTNMKVDVKTIDNFFQHEDISYLKINTVGTECDVIKGAKDTISRCKPIIGVAIFSEVDAWWKVPQLIWSINQDYQIYMRQYKVNATILYALPNIK